MHLLAAATVAAALGLAAASPALAATLKVPSETYPTIQSAVDAAGDGDTVSVAPGTYNEIVMVMDKTNLVIRGRARPVVNGPGFAFTVTGGSGVTITGFGVEGGGGAVSATNTAGLVVSKINVVAPSTVAFDFITCAGVRVTRCGATDATATLVQDTTSTGLVVEKCRFTGNGPGDIIRLSPYTGTNLGSNGAVVAKNRVEGGSTAIRFGGTGALIEKNTLLGLTSAGIYLDGTTDTTGTVVSKNKVEVTGNTYGIQSYEDQITFDRNRLTGGGIYTFGGGLILDRNAIRNPQGYGIYTLGNNNFVGRNKVLSGLADGIFLNAGIHTVERNRVVGCDGIGLYVAAGTGGSSLTNNSVAACDQYGILVLATPVTVTGNRSALNGEADYGDSNAEGVNALTGNRFGTTEFNYVP